MTRRRLSFFNSVVGIGGQESLAEQGASQRAGDGEHDERDWIPLRPELGAAIPGCHGSHEAEGESDQAKDQRMPDRVMGR